MLRYSASVFVIFCLVPFSSFAADDSVADIDRQRALVARFNDEVEKEQLKKEAERQAAAARQAEIKKKREEARIAAQFAGLSNKLSGLPKPPSFTGEFRTKSEAPTKDAPAA